MPLDAGVRPWQVAVLGEVLDARSVPRVSVVAHSYGTFFASRMMQLAPERVHSLCLVDPVAFNMFTGGWGLVCAKMCI